MITTWGTMTRHQREQFIKEFNQGTSSTDIIDDSWDKFRGEECQWTAHLVADSSTGMDFLVLTTSSNRLSTPILPKMNKTKVAFVTVTAEGTEGAAPVQNITVVLPYFVKLAWSGSGFEPIEEN